jgi:Sybindin-like family
VTLCFSRSDYFDVGVEKFLCSIDFFSFQLLSLAGADDGIEEIRASGMVLRCFQTRTGIKFVITAEPNTSMVVDLEAVLREIYVLYTECVLKDPFYELEMPIRSELFVQAVDSLIDKVEKMASTATSMKLTR